MKNKNPFVLGNKELLDEFYETHLDSFPEITKEQVKDIIDSKFYILYRIMVEGNYTSYRIKYLGNFKMYYKRAKTVLEKAKNALDKGLITEKHYNERTQILIKHINESKED